MFGIKDTKSHATTEQLETLLDFLDNHHDLARGFLRGSDGRERSKRLWQSIASDLNSLGGCMKTVDKWQKVWQDRKHLAKKANSAARISANATGGGPSTAPTLSQTELKILSIMGSGFGRGETGARVPLHPPPAPVTQSSQGHNMHDFLSDHQYYAPSQLGQQGASDSPQFHIEIIENVEALEEVVHVQKVHIDRDIEFGQELLENPARQDPVRQVGIQQSSTRHRRLRKRTRSSHHAARQAMLDLEERRLQLDEQRLHAQLRQNQELEAIKKALQPFRKPKFGNWFPISIFLYLYVTGFLKGFFNTFR